MEQEVVKYLYRITAQSNSEEITHQVNFLKGLEYEDVLKFTESEDLFKQPMNKHYRNFVVEPICSEQEWSDGVITYCPRCGTNIASMKIGRGDIFKCFQCKATVQCNIVAVNVTQNQ